MLTAVTVIVLGGLSIFILLFILINWDYNLRQARAQDLESFYGTEQLQRAREKYRLVRQIGAPECPDGTYSPNQLALWRQYQDLDKFDKAMTAFELEQIVGMRGYS